MGLKDLQGTTIEEDRAAFPATNPLDDPEGQLVADEEVFDEPPGDLPEAHRQVLNLGYFAGLSMSEIADELAIPLGTVKSRTAAALSKLRQALNADRGGVQ